MKNKETIDKIVRIKNRYKKFTMTNDRRYMYNLGFIYDNRHIDGDIVECGTWKGGMIAGAAELLGNDRNYFLFDSFEGLPQVSDIDGDNAKEWQKNTKDNCKVSDEFARRAMKMSGVNNYKIIKGWFRDTLKTEEFKNGISVLLADADWYESTKEILENLYNKINNNGIIIFDDYNSWKGCRRAVDEFLNKYNKKIEYRRLIHFVRVKK